MSRRSLLRTLGSRRHGERAAEWLGRVLDALPGDSEMDEETLGRLVHRVNGTLGGEYRHIGEDPEAYVDFWRRVADRLRSHPWALAVYADTLLLTGDADGARTSILAAFEADPTLIYRMSAEYRRVMEHAGGSDWAAYRALCIRAAELDDPVRHRDYITEEVQKLIADVGRDPELTREVLRILRPTST
jgi:hypothetical protein